MDEIENKDVVEETADDAVESAAPVLEEAVEALNVEVTEDDSEDEEVA